MHVSAGIVATSSGHDRCAHHIRFELILVGYDILCVVLYVYDKLLSKTSTFSILWAHFLCNNVLNATYVHSSDLNIMVKDD